MSRFRSVACEGCRGPWAGDGEADPKPLEACIALPFMDKSPRCGGRVGDSGIGLDFKVLTLRGWS